MEHQNTTMLTVFLLLAFSSVAVGLYLITDYYLDAGFPRAFGMACDKTIQDDSLYVNSHFQVFGINDYSDDNECTLELDAGTQVGARYKLDWERFTVEWSPNCTNDYLAIYDSSLNDITRAIENKYCGKTDPGFNGTQQYITMKFHTDSDEVSDGFRLLATRTLPAPCSDGYFLCESEQRCINDRLQCDGTRHCDDGTDEDDCNFWEKVIGGLLALGVGGMIGVLFVIVCFCGTCSISYCVCKKCFCKKKTAKVGAIGVDEPSKEKEQRPSGNKDTEQPKEKAGKKSKGGKATKKSSSRPIDQSVNEDAPWTVETDRSSNRPLDTPGPSVERMLSVTSLGETTHPRLTNVSEA